MEWTGKLREKEKGSTAPEAKTGKILPAKVIVHWGKAWHRTVKILPCKCLELLHKGHFPFAPATRGVNEPLHTSVTQKGLTMMKETGPVSPPRDLRGDERTLRLETALRRSEKLAMAGRLAASVMHEINNPSQAIADLVYLIAKEADHPELRARPRCAN